MPLRTLPDPNHLPALDRRHLRLDGLAGDLQGHPPRILVLYGSLRERSFSRLAAEEAARLLVLFGAEVRIFDPSTLPLTDSPGFQEHPGVRELFGLSLWSEGQVWCSPERHGQLTAVMKLQVDLLPLAHGALRPTQGRTLAVMQVSGGSQSFNAVNTMRLIGRWLRMLTIPNQSSIAKAWQEFDDAGRMRPSPSYERIVDVMEELVRYTLLNRAAQPRLVERYSERAEAARAAAVAAAEPADA